MSAFSHSDWVKLKTKKGKLMKNMLRISMIGTAALGLSVAAMANGGTYNNTYVQAPYSQPAKGKAPGFIVGGSLGFARADYGNTLKDFVKLAPSYSTHQGGFAGRAFVGYRFNQYIQTEFGYDYFPNNKYEASAGSQSVTFKEKTQAIDLIAKGMLPLGNFDLFATAGGAYVWSKVTGSSNVPGFTIGDAKKSQLRPTYGAGVAYNINPNVAIDASWKQIYGSKTTASDTSLKTPMINYFGLGVTVHIG